MSRFVNLEFDGESEDQSRLSKPQLKGEGFYCAEAQAAFENGDFEKGLRLYSKVLEFNPQTPAPGQDKCEC